MNASDEDELLLADCYNYTTYDDEEAFNASCFPGNFSPIVNITDDAFSEEFKIACVIVYSIIFIGGLVGNVLFCYIVISSRSMKNVTYHLLVNLSVSDLLISCLCGPLHVINSIILGHWPFGAFTCLTFSYMQGISVFVSSYTLVVISFERYMSILYPLKPIIPKGRSRYVILGIWVFSLLASIPNPIQTLHKDMGEVWICTSEVDLTFHISSVVFLFLQYFLPVALMSYFYSMVAKTIWSRRDICQMMDGTSHKQNKELQMLKSKRKMIKMLIVVVVCYTVCWLPFNVYWVLGLILPSLMTNPSFPYVFSVVHILTVSHTCINPVIYCWMNRRVRYGFMDIMGSIGKNIGKLQIIRKCFPRVDWESTRLTRNARQTQFTVVRRKNGRGGDADEIFSRNGSSIIGNRSTMSLTGIVRNSSINQGLGRSSSNRLGPRATTAASLISNDQSPTTGSAPQVKASSSANNMEMAELYSEEPLLHRVHHARFQTKLANLRQGQKISTISTSTNVSDLSIDQDMSPLTNGSGGSTGPAAPSLPKTKAPSTEEKETSTSPQVFNFSQIPEETGSSSTEKTFRKRSTSASSSPNLQKKQPQKKFFISSTDDMAVQVQKQASVEGGKKSKDGRHSLRMLLRNVQLLLELINTGLEFMLTEFRSLSTTTSGCPSTETSSVRKEPDPNSTPTKPGLSRSLSEEIQETVMSRAPAKLMDLREKSDERYN